MRIMTVGRARAAVLLAAAGAEASTTPVEVLVLAQGRDVDLGKWLEETPPPYAKSEGETGLSARSRRRARERGNKPRQLFRA